jgi:hypothetical protein
MLFITLLIQSLTFVSIIFKINLNALKLLLLSSNGNRNFKSLLNINLYIIEFFKMRVK